MPAKKRGRAASKGTTDKTTKKRRRGSTIEDVDEPEKVSSSSSSSSSSTKSSTSTSKNDKDNTKTSKDEDYDDDANDDDQDDEEESEVEYEDEPLQPKILPSRTTRGRRFNKLVGEAQDKDKEFWGHGTWEEEDVEDKDYEFENEKDLVDSDFDDEEEEEDESFVQVAKKKRSKASSSSRYSDPALKSKTARSGANKQIANKRPKRAPIPAKQRTFRSSTKARVKESQQTRKLQNEKNKKMAAARPTNKKETIRLTQEELLVQAAHTEVANRRSLELMLRMQDDKKKLTGPKAPYVGKLIRYTSRIGQPSIMTFEQFDELPKEINSIAPPPPKIEYCVITGMRAKYRDPKTGKPYATLEAFKQLRSQYAQVEVEN